jgi:outer membrane protein assembly factor BamB
MHHRPSALVASCSTLFLTLLVLGLATPGLSATNSIEAVAYQINALHDGATSASLGLPLHVRWTVPITGTITYPLIADGRVFTTFGTTLLAINARTGQTVWTQTVQGGWTGAAFGDDRIYAVGLTSQGAFMYAFDARTGTQIWTSSLEATGNYSFTSPPTTFNGTVYTAGAGGFGTLFAIRTSDGKLLWHETVDAGFNTSAAVTQHDVFVAFACPQVYDFNPVNGVQIWHYDGGCHGGGGSVPVVDRDLVYAEDDMTGPHNGIVLNADTGAVWGHFDSLYPMAFSQGIAFAIQYGGSNLTAMTARNGKLLWSIPANTNDAFAVPPIVDSSLGLVFEGTLAGLVTAYKVSSGKTAMTVNLGSPVAYGTSMALGEDMVVLQDGNGLVALSAH